MTRGGPFGRTLAAALTLALCSVSGCDAETEADAETDADAEGSPDAAMPVPLVEATQWAVADVGVDLFATMRPADVECDEERGYYLYETSWATLFEINTGWCNYLTVTQPLLEALEPGDTVEIRVYHFELTGGPGEGYLGVGIGPEIRWEQAVAIPSGSELVKGSFEVTEAIEAGTPVQFHVHNHGSNSWELYSIDRVGSGSGA